MAIKDLFIKSDTPEVSPVTTSEVSASAVNTAAPVYTAPATTPSIESNSAIVGKIWEKIIEKNLPGPDYLELKNNVSAFDDSPLTDEQKLIYAFKILQKNYPSFNKEVILRSIDTYVNVVNEEKSLGLSEVAKLKETNVDATEALIAKLKEDAAQLKQKYDEILHQIDEYTTKVATERLAITNKETMFVSSIETVLNTLTSDKAKISTLNI